MVFLLFISLAGYFLFIARICKWSIAIMPLFTVCLISSLLYLAGIFNVLAITAHLLFYAGIVFFVVYILLCLKEKRVPYEEIFNPGSIFFVLYFVYLYLICRSSFYCGWDVFSQWGLTTKDMVLSDKLVSPDSSAYFKSYPPGMTLFHYFVVSITGYSEGMVLFAHNLFLASAFMPLFQRIRRKQFYLSMLVFVISYGLFYIFGELQLTELMSDNIVGAVFGMSIASYFLFEGSNRGRLAHLIPVIFFLPLIKQIGVYMALCACAIIALDYIYSSFQRKFISIRTMLLTVIISGAIIAVPLVSYFSWKGELNEYKIQEILKLDLSLEKINNTFSKDNSTARDKETLSNFVKALYKEPVIPITKITVLRKHIDLFGGVTVVSCFFACLVLAMISIFSQPTPLDRRRIFICQSALIASFMAYCFIHLLLYLYSFGAYEGPRIASFSRYMSTFFLGWFYVFIGLFLVNPKQFKPPYGFVRLALKILVALSAVVVLFSFKDFIFAKKDYPSYRVEAEQYIPVVNKYCPLNSKVYFIWQNDNGLRSFIFGYGISPIKTNSGGRGGSWSLGEPYYVGDVWTADHTPEQLLNFFKEFDYVLVAKADERFWKRYGMLFNDAGSMRVPSNHFNSFGNGSLFRVIKESDGKIFVRKIE